MSSHLSVRRSLAIFLLVVPLLPLLVACYSSSTITKDALNAGTVSHKDRVTLTYPNGYVRGLTTCTDVDRSGAIQVAEVFNFGLWDFTAIVDEHSVQPSAFATMSDITANPAACGPRPKLKTSATCLAGGMTIDTSC